MRVLEKSSALFIFAIIVNRSSSSIVIIFDIRTIYTFLFSHNLICINELERCRLIHVIVQPV